MSKYRFAVSNTATRHEGTISGPTFAQAVESLWQHVDVHHGDLLEIGVQGFPPARFQCAAMSVTGEPMWQQAA